MKKILLLTLCTFILLTTKLYASDYDIIDLGLSVHPYDININGQVVGRVNQATGFDGFLWDQTTGFRTYTDLGWNVSEKSLYDINDHGEVGNITSGYYGGLINNPGQQIWSDGTNLHLKSSDGSLQYIMPQNLNPLFLEMNNNGEITGHTYNGSHTSFVWSPVDGMTYLNSFGGSDTKTSGINDLGIVVGSADYSDGKERAALWDEDGNVFDMGTISGYASHAYDINNVGYVVGDVFDSTFPPNHFNHAFIWDPNTSDLYDLNDLVTANSGWELRIASAINDDGYIIGDGYFNGVAHGFLLKPTLVPEPVSTVLFLAGGSVMGMGVIFRRRHSL